MIECSQSLSCNGKMIECISFNRTAEILAQIIQINQIYVVDVNINPIIKHPMYQIWSHCELKMIIQNVECVFCSAILTQM